jgi:hypothetical protein
MFPPKSVETINLLLEEADILMKNIKKAKTLADLLHTKTILQTFRKNVERIDSSNILKNKLVFLEAQWNKQFRIWKANR